MWLIKLYTIILKCLQFQLAVKVLQKRPILAYFFSQLYLNGGNLNVLTVGNITPNCTNCVTVIILSIGS